MTKLPFRFHHSKRYLDAIYHIDELSASYLPLYYSNDALYNKNLVKNGTVFS